MGEWSDYFEDFPEENPANQWNDTEGDTLRARVAREAVYSPKVLAENAEIRKRREADEIHLLGMRLKDREQAQAELHRSIGGLLEAYAWFDVNLGIKIKSYSNNDPDVIALLKPTVPMKLRLDCLKRLVDNSPLTPEVKKRARWVEWIEHAEQIRLQRNEYAHGRWISSSPAHKDFRFAALSWPGESEPAQSLIAVSPMQIDERSSEIWKLTRSIEDVLEPFFPRR
jgi:hypothetical protein